MPGQEVRDSDAHLVTSLNKFYYIYNKLHRAMIDLKPGTMGKAAIQKENALHAKAPRFHSWNEDKDEAIAALMELVAEAMIVIESAAPPMPRLKVVGGKTRARSVRRKHARVERTIPNVFVDLDEAVRYSNISRSRLDHLVRTGQIPKQERSDNRIKISISTLIQVMHEETPESKDLMARRING